MKKIFGLFLLIVMMLPIFVDASSTVTGNGIELFANGVAITIQASVPEDGTVVTLDGFTATGTSAYVVWAEGENTKYVGVASTAHIYGGSDGTASAVTVASTNVRMTGGQVTNLYGGNKGADASVVNKTLVAASRVTGNVVMNMTGGSAGSLYGGGRYNAAVDGTVTINISDATFTRYVVGGVHGNGKEGYVGNVGENIFYSNAVVNKVDMNVKNSTIVAVALGGGGITKVNEAKAIIGDGVGTDDTLVGYVYVGGIQSYLGKSDLVLSSDLKVDGEVASINRGFVADGKLTINGTYIANLYTGATVGALSSDSTGNAAVLGGLDLIINDASRIQNAQLTPQVMPTSTGYKFNLGSINLVNNDDENEVTFHLNTYNSGNATIGTAVNVFTTASDDTVTIGENVKMVLNAMNSLNNAGTIVVNGTYQSNGTFNNQGTFEINGLAKNNGEIINANGTFDVNGTLEFGALGTLDNEDGKINTGVDAVIPNDGISGDIPKVVLDGNAQTYDANKTADKEKGLVVEFSGVLDTDFTAEEGKVYVDNEVVDPKNYTLSRGSVVVTFKPDYLNYLSSGTHVMKLVYDDGSYAQAAFATANTNPQTSDTLLFAIIIGFISIAGICIAGYKFNKQN